MYRRRFPIPGNCYVSALCFEPRVAVEVLQKMIATAGDPAYSCEPGGRLSTKSRPGSTSAVAWQFDKNAALRFRFRCVLDATEMGDLLPLAKLPYVVGSEPKSDTGEPHAGSRPTPACVQSFTYPFAVERSDGEDHAIAKPADYDAILKRQDFTLRMNYPVEYGWKGIVEYSHVR